MGLCLDATRARCDCRPMADSAHLTLRESTSTLLRRAGGRWYVLLVGAVGGVWGAANELFFGGDLKMPGWLGWALLMLSVLVAIFWGFHDESNAKVNEIAAVKAKTSKLEGRIRKDEETRNCRLSIEDVLWGAELERRFVLHDEDPLSPKEKRKYYGQWRKGTADYLRAVLGPAAAARLYASKDGSVINDIAYEFDSDRCLLDLKDLRAAGAKREVDCGVVRNGEFILKPSEAQGRQSKDETA